MANLGGFIIFLKERFQAAPDASPDGFRLDLSRKVSVGSAKAEREIIGAVFCLLADFFDREGLEDPLTLPPGDFVPAIKTLTERCWAADILLADFFISVGSVRSRVVTAFDQWSGRCSAVFEVIGQINTFFDQLITVAGTEWTRLETTRYRKKTAECKTLLIHEKRRYASIFDSMHEPACIIDRQGVLVEVNEAFSRFFKKCDAAQNGGSFYHLFRNDSDALARLIDQVQGKGSFSNLDVSFPAEIFFGAGLLESAQDNESSVVECPSVRQIRLAGVPLGEIEIGRPGWLVILQDITRQKYVEQALRDSEEKYRSLIVNLPDVPWRADVKGRVVFIGENAAGICGVPSKELVNVDRFTRILAEDCVRVKKAYRRLFKRGIRYDITYRFQRSDGSLIWLHDRAEKISVIDGVPYADGLFWDVSELKRIEEELDEYRCWLEDFVDERTEDLLISNDRLRQQIAQRLLIEKELVRMAEALKNSNAELEHFAYVASHDLKEPLMLVAAFSRKLFDRYADDLDDRGREYLSRIMGSVKKLQALVDALLQLSRVTTSAVEFSALDLNALIRDLVEDLEESIKNSDASIEFAVLPVVIGDPIQVRQLFQNIISNALKYQRDEESPVVTISSRIVDQGFCEIIVMDNGIGFEEKFLDRIFEPFVRLDHHGKYEGTGMGLTTCRKIVSRHGGEISAKSQPGAGSRFIIRLPIPQTDFLPGY
ncbi:MAG: PAS domain S-box protein [Proteobacteria bacterium]|nr:PAS domain S-box protein [Pseudomonadota bacterium]MBU1688875.1 PAS domain S-box protein [Pseudomonadota bacterium]